MCSYHELSVGSVGVIWVAEWPSMILQWNVEFNIIDAANAAFCFC
jgi:hypothetical protein